MKNTKQLLQGIAIGAITTTMLFSAIYSAPIKKQIDIWYTNIKLVVDGSPLTLKDAKGNKLEPFTYNGTIYFPARSIGQILGKEISWDQNTNTVYIGERPKLNQNNEYGNTSGNIVNAGIAAQYGGWIYFNNYNDNMRLYRMKIDGSGKQKISDDNIINIGIVGDWVFYGGYNGIFKMKPDGTSNIRICNDNALSPNVVGEWIYYSNQDDKGKLYKIKTDGSNKTKLCDSTVQDIQVSGDWIYYAKTSEDEKIYKMKTDGSLETKVYDDAAFCLNIVGEWIYFMEPYSGIYRIKTDGSAKTRISDIGDAHSLNVSGDWIYYSNWNDNQRLYRIKTDGSQRTRLTENNAFNINIVDTWIYYVCQTPDKGLQLYKMKFDGTQNQLLK